MNIFAATLLAFFPKRYRTIFTRYELPTSGAVVSGIMETAISLGLLIHGYFVYADERIAALPVSVMTKAAEKGGESAIMGVGGILLLEYVIHVTTILLVFLTVEGLVRTIAAIGGGVVLPSLPLLILALIHAKLGDWKRENQLGKRIRDDVQVVPGNERLQVSSCRPKSWTQLTTIAYDGVFYELLSENQGPAPRPFVYILRKKPPSAVIRGIYAYHPDEVLQTK
jgi:hypothetical protein